MTATATLNAKSTKADVIAAYEALSTEHEKFRKTVVRKARAAARDNGWCEVVEETLCSMGLDDLLPPVTVIQMQHAANGEWSDESDHYDTLREGRDELKDWRLDEYRNQERRVRRFGNFDTRVTITADTDFDALVEELRLAHKNVKETEPFMANEYPKFRLAQRTYKGDLIRVVDEGGSAVAPRA